MELLTEYGFRSDGRKPDELRKIYCKLGVFNHADGSSYFQLGNTKVLVAVYGPHECKMKGKILHDKALINCQYSMATFSTGERKERPRGDRKSLMITQHLNAIFNTAILTSLYPQSQIDIFVEVLQADGSNFCASVNAATLALIDAGISIKDYVCCTSASSVNNIIITDVNYTEENSDDPELIVALSPKSSEVIYAVEKNGRIHDSTNQDSKFRELFHATTNTCYEMHKYMTEIVHSHVQTIHSHKVDM